jgi:hypothetical protein
MLGEAGYPNGFSIALRAPNRALHPGLSGGAGGISTTGKRRGQGRGGDRRLAELHRALAVPPDRTPIQMYMLGQAGPYLDTDGELFGPLYSGMWLPNG